MFLRGCRILNGRGGDNTRAHRQEGHDYKLGAEPSQRHNCLV